MNIINFMRQGGSYCATLCRAVANSIGEWNIGEWIRRVSPINLETITSTPAKLAELATQFFQNIPNPFSKPLSGLITDVSIDKLESLILTEVDNKARSLNLRVSANSFAEREIPFDLIERISKAYPNLKDLSLEADDTGGFQIQLSKEGFNSLSSLKRLKSLKISNFSADQLSFEKNQAIQILKIQDCTFSKFPEEIKNLEQLKELSIARNYYEEALEDDLASNYSALLSSQKKVQKLQLQDCRLTSLPEVLKDPFTSFRKLKELDLLNNPFDSKPAFPALNKGQSILLDENNDSSNKNLKGTKIMAIGATRTGKSTLVDVLAGKTDIEKETFTMFPETKGSSLRKVTLPDVLIDEKPADLYVHDTPGLFEVRKNGINSRTNKELLSSIFEDNARFYGQKSLKNVDVVLMTYSLKSGIHPTQTESFQIINPFLQRMGLSKTAKLFLVLTNAENTTREEADNKVSEILGNEKMGPTMKKYGIGIQFSGACPISKPETEKEPVKIEASPKTGRFQLKKQQQDVEVEITGYDERRTRGWVKTNRQELIKDYLGQITEAPPEVAVIEQGENFQD